MGVFFSILYGLFGIFYMRYEISISKPKNISWVVLAAMFWPIHLMVRLLLFIIAFVISLTQDSKHR